MKGRHETTAPKPQTASFENPADQAALAELQAAEAAGGDPFGDHDEDDTPAATVAAPAAPAETPAEGGEEGDDADEDEGAAADATTTAAPSAEEQAAAEAAAAEAAAPAAPAEAAAPPAPAPLQFKTKGAEALQADYEALMAKKAEAFQLYSDGDPSMPAATFNAIDAEVMKGLMAIASQQALLEASVQQQQQTSQQALDALIASSKSVLDYAADPKAASQFNNAVSMLQQDPDMAGLPAAEIYSKAHSVVLSLRGIKAAATPAAPTPAAPRKDMAGPVTLRTLPAAATPNATGGISEELSRLSGLDFEERIGAMSREQRNAWLDS